MTTTAPSPHPTPRPTSSRRRRGRPLGQLGVAVRAVLLATLVLGLAYPLLVTGVARLAFPDRAGGSLLERDGVVVGSALLGQDPGEDPAYFWGRPSAGGHDPLATGASNLAQDNPELLAQVVERRARVAAADGVDPADVAPDALLASGSGLDPHVSPAYAAQQVARVARERGLPEREVRALVADHTEGRTLGVLGEPRVAVLPLNLALDDLTR